MDLTVATILRSHTDHTAPALRCGQQQGERQPRLGADSMVRLELRYLILGPCVVAIRLVWWQLDAERRIIGAEALSYREIEQATQGFQPITGGDRSHAREHVGN